MYTIHASAAVTSVFDKFQYFIHFFQVHCIHFSIFTFSSGAHNRKRGVPPAPFPNELIILGEIRRNNCRKRCVLNQTHLISICILLEFIQKSKCLHYLFSFAFLPFSFVSFLRLHNPVKLFKSRCDHFIHIIVFIIPESSAENHVFLFVRQFFILFI